ncbi:DUF3152 domain-containing protein [Streptomyces sp. R302]|uniref:DUF3152 domain-containing protein n=1 Tax=unclassified Streptomyces TaxID=2593676 RepID=UPI00145E8657|nr:MULTISPECIES: DUF3152 domain-containing protein [unclassified Streptomyces]NML52248.1 DUF3152 domain-containing protein [Streptomyces sp. R301]NML82286.1 DUF3152 domain-containing protein [Streptomyces sp. R302]
MGVSLGAGVALAHFQEKRDEAAAPAVGSEAPRAPGPTTTATTPKAKAKPTPTPSKKPKPKPTPTATKKKPPTVPQSGPGTFTSATASGRVTGTSGTLRRYRVQIEDGVDLSARGTAEEIEAILAHPRGWAAHGRGRFQLVASDADFVIRIATPDTADALCARQGLNTHGELNCETTDGVVVNLKRWMLGSPTFAGPPEEYRHLIINHEVGHEIGIRQHMDCGGPGKPAPAMMQQIKGLNGCRSNAFPYSEEGIYITGPIVS